MKRIIFIIGLCILLAGCSNKPECYINYEQDCIKGYDVISHQGRLVGTEMRVCCQKPHYLLQGLDKEIVEDALVICMHSPDLTR